MPRNSKARAWLEKDRLQMLRHWKRAGLTDADVAKKIGIAPPTLKDWKNRYPSIAEALQKGFEELVGDAEEALLSRFVTQTIVEEKEEAWQDQNGTVKKHKTVTKKQVLPDTTAIIFFLKAKGGWRDNADLTKITSSISEQRRRELEDAFNAKQ